MKRLNLRSKLNIFVSTLKEVFISSLPLAAIMIIVCGFIAPLDSMSDYIKLIVGYISVVFGQALFLDGLNISILPIGKLVGGSLVNLKNAVFIIFFWTCIWALCYRCRACIDCFGKTDQYDYADN
ncbi:MAG TPA: DUF1538 family protein [Acetivibrio clariflavus]|nr:DUF1538 family protein [Acetivibrio clariflavus]